MKRRFVQVVVTIVTTGACRSPATEHEHVSTSSEAWLAGGLDDRFARVAKHLRGFDVAMVETGYRYRELHRVGNEQNWAYALYHLDKIETAVSHAVERRPKRAASAAMLAPSVARVREAVQSRDPGRFQDAFRGLTETCNGCHVLEQVAFIHIEPPATAHE